MRPYVRPLIVTFSALALASLFSYAAIALTEPAAPTKRDAKAGVVDADAPDVETRAKIAFMDAKKAAENGDPAKLMTLATFHLLGLGTEQSEAEAARLHRLGAEKGHAGCQFMWGRELIMGVGVKKDAVAGLAWIRKSAAQQDPEAEYFLHAAYRDGEGVNKDAEAARAWLLKAAEHGQKDARVDVAEEILIAKDKGRFKSVSTWVRPGALEGHPKSCHVMSFVYHSGIGVKPDPIESVAWRLVMLNAEEDADAEKYREAYDALSPEDQAAAEKRAKVLCGQRDYKSAFARDPAELEAERQAFAKIKLRAEAGDLEAQYELSQRLEDGEGTKADIEAAVRWARRAAEHGHVKSQYRLGVYLVNGEGVIPDPKEAYLWFRKAAEQGDAYAERAVAISLHEGNGVKADPVEAKKWLLRAAEHDQPQAQWQVGCEYYGQKPDIARDAIAARWFRKSAEQLHPRGLISLGICYRQGRGVSKDPIEGMAWMMLGNEQYDNDQKSFIDGLVETCTDEDLAKINERAKILKKECRDKFMAKMEAKKK